MSSATLVRLAIGLLIASQACVPEVVAAAFADATRNSSSAQADTGGSAEIRECGEAVEWPRARSTPPPKFPKEARKKGIQGVVVIRTTMLVNGKLGTLEVIDADHPEFVKPALRAVRKWTFEPATCDGRPVEATYTLRVAFKLPSR